MTSSKVTRLPDMPILLASTGPLTPHCHSEQGYSLKHVSAQLENEKCVDALRDVSWKKTQF